MEELVSRGRHTPKAQTVGIVLRGGPSSPPPDEAAVGKIDKSTLRLNC